MSKPWEQREDESKQEYARFQEYLQIGPKRTLAMVNSARNGNKQGSKKIGGRVAELSSKYEWVDRAAAYDIEMFQTVGYDAISAYTENIINASRQAAAAMQKCKPKNWMECMEYFNVIKTVIPQETLAALLSRQDNAGLAAGGLPGPARPQEQGVANDFR